MKRLFRKMLAAVVLSAAGCGISSGAPVTPPTEFNRPVDFSKIRFWVGEGEHQAAFIYQATYYGAIGDNPSNLVFGYRWADGETPDIRRMFDDITSADPRFIEVTFEGDLLKSFRYLNYDGLTARRFRQSTSWNSEIFVSSPENPNDYQLTDEMWSHNLTDGETVVWRYVDKEKRSLILTYLLYRPAADETGVFIPDNIDFYHDNYGLAKVPVFVSLGGSLDDHKVTELKIESLADESPLNAYLVDNGWEFDELTCFKDFPLGIVPFKATVKYTSASDQQSETAIESATGNFEVFPPARPLVALNFRNDRYVFKSFDGYVTINSTAGYEMPVVMQPEDPTYSIVYESMTGVMGDDTGKPRSLTSRPIMLLHSPAGEGTVTYTSVLDPEITATATAYFGESVANPVTGISLDEISIPYRHLWGEIADHVIPEDATMKDMTVTEIEDPSIVGFYDSTQDLISYQAGETYVTFAARDGSGFTKRIKVTVLPPESYDGDFQKGFFVMNEGWYSHASTSINFFPDEGEPYYNAFAQMNPGLTISGTGLGAFYWGDRLFIANYDTAASEQLPGVFNPVLDIAGLKQMPYSNEVGSEGVGVSQTRLFSTEDKGYLFQNIEDGSINRYRWENPDISVIGQIKAGRYIFVGTHDHLLVIDPDTEEICGRIEGFANAMKMAQVPDGSIWVLCADGQTGTLINVDPVKLEIAATVDMPEAAKYSDSYLWYHATRFFASTQEDALFWLIDTTLYKWVVSEDNSTVTALTTMFDCYGGPSFDPVRNQVLSIFSRVGYAGRYCYNTWYDPATGEMTRRVQLPENYWFPSMAVYPSRYLPEINLESIEMSEGTTLDIELSEYLHDEDPADFDFNIIPALEDAGDTSVAEVSLDALNRTLRVSAAATGATGIRLSAMSRGNVVSRDIPVTVKEDVSTGVRAIRGGVNVDGRHLSVTGHEGSVFYLIDMQGNVAEEHHVRSGAYAARINAGPGIYVLTDRRGITLKAVIR